MDAIRQRVRREYQGSFTKVLLVLAAIYAIVWSVVVVVFFSCVRPEHEIAHPGFKIGFVVSCVIACLICIFFSICGIECWIQEPLVRRPYDPIRDGNRIPLVERGPRNAAPPAAPPVAQN